MNNSPNVWCVVPAAGVGKRFGASVPKQYLTLNGKTVVEHTLERLQSVASVREIVVVISSEDHQFKSLPVGPAVKSNP